MHRRPNRDISAHYLEVHDADYWKRVAGELFAMVVVLLVVQVTSTSSDKNAYITCTQQVYTFPVFEF